MEDKGQSTELTRVYYGERQIITRDDLADEQQFLIAARRRHNLAQHDWGIVNGLELEDDFGAVKLAAGLAIDGYGRELILSQTLRIPLKYLVQLNADHIGAWLTYALVDETVSRTTGEQRTREEARVRLETVSSADEIDPRRPTDVPSSQPGQTAEDAPLDDPNLQWPVFIGLVKRDSPISFHVVSTPDRRPYAGLRGEMITSPSGAARVQVGAEAQGDNRAFAVSTLDAGGKIKERLSIDVDGNSIARGSVTVLRVKEPGIPKAPETTPAAQDQKEAEAYKAWYNANTAKDYPKAIELAKAYLKKFPTGRYASYLQALWNGNLIIERAAPEITNIVREGLAGCDDSGESTRPRYWGIEFGPVPPPKAATPWQVYHALVPPPEKPAPQIFKNELRFEFLDPGKKGNRKGNLFVVGRRDGVTGKFIPCLSVDAECTVTINQDVKVKGRVVLGEIQADPRDPRFQALVLSGWLQGMLSNTAQLSTFYGAAMSASLNLPDEGFVSPDHIQATVTFLNTGKFDINDIQLSETHSGAVVTIIPPFPRNPFNLRAGASEDVPLDIVATSDGNLSIEIKAEGVSGAGGYKVAASCKGSVLVVQKASVTAAIDAAPSDGVVNVDVTYIAVITNSGTAVLSHVTAIEQVDAGGTPLFSDLIVDGVLQPGETHRFTRRAKRSTEGNLILTVSATGAGPGKHNLATSSSSQTVNIHNPANITVEVDGLEDANVNTQQNFTIAITNHGDETVSNLSVTCSANLAGTSLGAMPSPAGIAAGGVVRMSVSFTPTESGHLVITADVQVEGPGGDTQPVSDSQSANINGVIA